MKKEDGKRWCVMEINLISAQGLKLPSGQLWRMQTYALAWTDPSVKLRTGIDRVGGENPTWNDRFLFQVTPEFLTSETSGVSVEIYAVNCLRDTLIGTVRFLIGNFLDIHAKIPSFTALQIRRPSGRFHGVLNIGATVMSGSDFPALRDKSAVCYRDLMGKSHRLRRRKDRGRESENCCRESPAHSWFESPVHSDSSESSTSSSSSTAFKDLNAIRDVAGSRSLKTSSYAAGLLCGLVLQRKVHLHPCDQNIDVFSGPKDE
ncbi:hypothetical protein FNV43_RR18197 [Rhamnella rubrinervis]|uniref:C2 domain-containing protein n=1 Tax=Rhamnella rubrinervis TaxID=2594499 RepID=A0A8K0E5D3_9ROSA|nr:hypothetical protein FNV43_RR18197 [Rhamnella rubrinervis]